MSVANGNLANQTTFNNAFMSRTGDTSTTGAITQSNTTQSTTKDTGAIVTEGGVGIEKNLNVGGTIKNSDTTASTTKDTGAIVTEGGLGVEGNINAGGNITATGTMAASNLSGTNTGDVVLGNVGSAPNATGATLSGQNLNLEPADATNPGVVSTGAQSFAGDKTFVDDVIITGDLTVNGTTTTLNTATLDVEDVNITVNNGGNDASSEGAGLTVERTTTNATILHADALASKFKCGASGSESEIMTVGSTQTITGSKTITTPMTYEEEGSAPSTPSAGYRKFYAKSDGFYSLNSSGVEEQIGSGGGGSGGINYIDNPNAVTDTTGWAAYADAAGTTPVDGTGGSPNSTFTRTESSPLRDAASFLFTKNSGASRQGEGFSYAFTIDAADKGKVLQGSFDYAIASGTFVDDAMEVFVYDVTNAALIYCSPSKLKNHSLAAEKFGFEFQTSSSSTSYRLIVHVGVTTNSANTIKFDNFSVGPAAKLYGNPTLDFRSFTPTFTGFGTPSNVACFWAKDGDRMIVNFSFTSGTSTAVPCKFSLPFTVDTSKLGTTANTVLASIGYNANSPNILTVLAPTSNEAAVYFGLGTASATNTTPVNGSTLISSGTTINGTFSVPIVGWSSSVIMSSDASTRVVAAYSYKNGSTTYNSNAARQQVLIDTMIEDTHGMRSGNTLVIPVNGYYDIKGSALWTGANMVSGGTYEIMITTTTVNGTILCVADQRCAASGAFVTTKCERDGVYLTAGTVLCLGLYSNQNHSVNTVTIDGTFHNWTYISVKQVQGPSQVAASESINARYNTAAAQVIATATSTIVDFGTKVFDSHNSTTTGASWKYTAPANGTYSVSARVLFDSYAWTAGNKANLALYKNGTYYANLDRNPVTASVTYLLGLQGGSAQVKLLAGDYVDIRVEHDRGSNTNLYNDVLFNWVDINRSGNY